MKSNRLYFLNILVILSMVLLMVPLKASAAPLAVVPAVSFVKEFKNAAGTSPIEEARVGDTVTIRLRFSLDGSVAQPINILVTDLNPAPTLFQILPGSITGGATYKPAETGVPEGVTWTGKLVPGSQELIVTFQVKLIGTPEPGGSLVWNTATMVDTAVPGSLPQQTAMDSLWVLPTGARVIFNKQAFINGLPGATATLNDQVMYEISMRLAAGETQPINVKATDVNPAPAYLAIQSVTGGAVFSPTTNIVSWEGTLVPGSEAVVFSFTAEVTGTLPAGSTVVTNTAVLNDTATPGSLAQVEDKAVITLVSGAVPTVAFSSDAYSVGEAAGPAVITVTLSAPAAAAVTVPYTVTAGTATDPDDYLGGNGTLTFDPGQTSKTISLDIINDDLDEFDETVDLALGNPTNATLGTPSQAVLTIVDDDAEPEVSFSSATYSVAENAGPATITVNLSAASGREVSVDYTTLGTGTATEGTDYTAASGTLTFAPGETSKTFNVALIDDALDEADETVPLELSAAVYATLPTPPAHQAFLTIVDDDAEPTVSFSADKYSVTEKAGSVTITVNLSAASGKQVTVNYATANGTATEPGDYTAASGTLTFAPGETSKTFTITVKDENWAEVTETVLLTLSQPVNAALGTPNSAVLSIIDEATGLTGKILYLAVMTTRKLP